MSWVDAIKKYAEMNGGKFVIPKRDSEDYAKVKALQERMAKGEKIEMPKGKAKPEKVANKDAVVAPVVEEVAKKRKAIPKPVKVENKEVAPVELPADPPKKAKKIVKKDKTPNEPVVEAVMPEVQPVKVKKEKPAKVANLDVVPEEKPVVEVKAPKKTPKVIREEKKEAKDKQSEVVAGVRAKRALIDARMRILNTPVSLEFN
jgi:hypothetical protein